MNFVGVSKPVTVKGSAPEHRLCATVLTFLSTPIGLCLFTTCTKMDCTYTNLTATSPMCVIVQQLLEHTN